jgi:PPIC-type PPIASE domain
MTRVLREPLLHFLLAGAALFVLYGWMGGGAAERPERVVVTTAQVERIAATFERTWMRPPTPEDLRGLVDDFVNEEILYREAVALGLDRDDLIVRRRMRQKMEFLNDGLADEVTPDADTLRAFMEENAETYRLPSRVSFTQVYVNPKQGEEPVEERARAVLATLVDGTAAAGDPTLLPRQLDAVTPAQVDGAFGAGFSDALAAVQTGVWTGPLPSAFGLHLVHVTARTPSRMPELAEVRASVERDWTAAHRDRSRARFHEAMRARYDIEVRMPPGS